MLCLPHPARPSIGVRLTCAPPCLALPPPCACGAEGGGGSGGGRARRVQLCGCAHQVAGRGAAPGERPAKPDQCLLTEGGTTLPFHLAPSSLLPLHLPPQRGSPPHPVPPPPPFPFRRWTRASRRWCASPPATTPAPTDSTAPACGCAPVPEGWVDARVLAGLPCLLPPCLRWWGGTQASTRLHAAAPTACPPQIAPCPSPLPQFFEVDLPSASKRKQDLVRCGPQRGQQPSGLGRDRPGGGWQPGLGTSGCAISRPSSESSLPCAPQVGAAAAHPAAPAHLHRCRPVPGKAFPAVEAMLP